MIRQQKIAEQIRPKAIDLDALRDARMTDFGRLPPGMFLVLGALLLPLLPVRLRPLWFLALPVLSFWHLWEQPLGLAPALELFGYRLQPVRIDGLSLVWGYVFHLATLLACIFALRVRSVGEHVAALIYAGAAIGAVFAGDLVTLFVFWELTAVASVFLIWARGTDRALRAGIRYLIIQVGSGVLLLAGILVKVGSSGAETSLTFERFELVGLSSWLIFLAFGIKAAFPLLHNWLQDAYPEATFSGTVFLSTFTTKMAIYALARGFPGTEILIWVGAAMAAFPIFYAIIENDLRRVLAYSLNNQLGFMVVGVGIGTELALNGTAAHAFTHVLYKSLLFMSMGAVLYRTGTCEGSKLGGLYKSMPWTATFCCIGAASISAFPLFSGFISKSLILSAAGDGGLYVVWLILLFASAGVLLHAGVELPYFGFFGHDTGKRFDEAPTSMLVAMGLTAAGCVILGVFPSLLYDILPFPVDYDPFTPVHIVRQLQLLFFAGLAFAWLEKAGIYPAERPSINLDSDWTYRKVLPALWRGIESRILVPAIELMKPPPDWSSRLRRPLLASSSWSTGTIVWLAAVALAAYLLLVFL